MWTSASSFELCVLQVDPDFSFFSIHEGDENQTQCIPLSKVSNCVIGEQASQLCQQVGIRDSHLCPETVLVVVHGIVPGGPVSVRNLCVFLVDTMQKQRKLRQCFQTVMERGMRAARERSSRNASAADQRAPMRADGGRNSTGMVRPVLGADAGRAGGGADLGNGGVEGPRAGSGAAAPTHGSSPGWRPP